MDVLLMGDAAHREFAAAVAWLGERARLAVAGTVQAGLAEIAETESPRLVVLAQSRPGEFSKSEVEQLHAAVPLARLAALLGSWCEGETRSGRPWPGVTRIYWHEWKPRLASLLERFAAPIHAGWSLPRTATDAEWLLATPVPTQAVPHGVVAINARRNSTFASLGDVCQMHGLAAVWLPSDQARWQQGFSIGLWDSAGWGPFEIGELKRFVDFCDPAPVVALLDFPRLDEHEQALAAGAEAVVSKPFLITDLAWHFERLLTRASRAA